MTRSRGCHLFRAEVVLRPNTKADFNLTYQELLQRRLGVYEHMVFLNPGQVVNDLRVDVKIRESVEILNVTGRIEATNSTAGMSALLESLLQLDSIIVIIIIVFVRYILYGE